MDIGLYKLKFVFRNLFSWVLPYFKNCNPNFITCSILPVGMLTAWALHETATCPEFFLLVMILILIRMVLATLDGYVASHFNKFSERGEILNRVLPEICDTMWFFALILAYPQYIVLGLGCICLAWLTSFLGLLPLTIERKVISIGPLGQTDRLVSLAIFSFAAFLEKKFLWPTEAIYTFFCWCLLGGAVTVLNRLYTLMRQAEQKF
jgi:phosphatidylglycerophosphate synthase